MTGVLINAEKFVMLTVNKIHESKLSIKKMEDRAIAEIPVLNMLQENG